MTRRRASRFAWVLVLLLVAGGGAYAGDPVAWREDESFGDRGRGRQELREPVDVALLKDGAIAVLDRDREAVVLFSAAGRWVRTLGGSRGQGDLELRKPSALAADAQERLWIVDAGNHRVVVADLEGKVLRTFGGLGSHEGRFRHPADLTFDRSGRVYVADAGNERVQVFRPDGGFLAAWERRSAGRRDRLGEPVSVAYSDLGRGGLWVLSRGWSRLERFSLDGDWEESLELGPETVKGGEFGRLEVEPVFYRMFLSDVRGGRVVAVDRKGVLLGAVVGSGEAPLRPGGVAVGRRLEVYVPDAQGGRVVKYDRE